MSAVPAAADASAADLPPFAAAFLPTPAVSLASAPAAGINGTISKGFQESVVVYRRISALVLAAIGCIVALVLLAIARARWTDPRSVETHGHVVRVLSCRGRSLGKSCTVQVLLATGETVAVEVDGAGYAAVGDSVSVWRDPSGVMGLRTGMSPAAQGGLIALAAAAVAAAGIGLSVLAYRRAAVAPITPTDIYGSSYGNSAGFYNNRGGLLGLVL